MDLDLSARTFIKNLYKYKALQFVLVASLFFSYQSVELENIYFTKNPITLTTEQNSPAYAALEDSHQNYTMYFMRSPGLEYEDVPLQWGENKNLWVLQNSQFMKYTQQAQELNPISINTSKVKKEIIAKDPLMRVLEPPAEAIADSQIAIKRIEDSEINPERVAMANALMIGAQESETDNNYTMDQLASQGIDLDEIIENNKGNVYQGQQNILITGNQTKPLNANNHFLGQFAANDKQPKTDKDYKKHFKNYMMRGKIDLSALGEISFVDHNKVVIYRQVDGEPAEKAFVDLNKNYYEIHVNEMTGYLIAEAYDDKNQLVGFKQVDLLAKDMTSIDLRDVIVKQNLKLQSSEELLKIKALSGYTTTQYDVPLQDAPISGGLVTDKVMVSAQIDGLDERLELDKNFEITSDMFTKNSNMLIKLEAKNHWGSLAIGLGHSVQKMRLYKNTLVEALLDNYKESHDGYGVVWGRVVDENGQPIKGAKVEIAGDLAKGPFYFNEAHLVDYQRQTTGYDGLFAFVKVIPGLQATRATIDGKDLPVELTVVDDQMVSYVEIRSGVKKHISVESFNPITKNNIDTSYKLIGSDKIYDTYSDNENIELWSGQKGVTLLESDPGEGFELTRHFIDRQKNHHKIPVVSTVWLNSLFEQKSIRPDSQKGVLVGYVMGDDFEVFTNADLDGWSSRNIIYFDEKGRALHKNIGRAGGGFVMYDLPESLSSLSILSKNTNKVYTSLILSDRDFVSVALPKFFD